MTRRRRRSTKDFKRGTVALVLDRGSGTPRRRRISTWPGRACATATLVHCTRCRAAASFNSNSLTYSSKTGQYAVAYFKRSHPKSDVILGFVNPSGAATEHKIMAGWKANSRGRSIRAVYDAKKDSYMIVALKDPGKLCYQFIKKSGAARCLRDRDSVVFRTVDTTEPDAQREWDATDAIFVDDKEGYVAPLGKDASVVT